MKLNVRLFKKLLLFSLFITLLGFGNVVNGQSTGWLSPATTKAENNVGNQDNVFTSNNSRATWNDSDDWADYGDFNISIPVGSVIYGIEVRAEGYRSASNDRNMDVLLSFDNGSNYTSSQQLPINVYSSGTENYFIVGSNIDNWGHSLTETELNNTNFRVRLDATGGGGTLYIDHLQINVYYGPPTSPYTITTPGASTFTVPSCVTSITVEAWGGGGRGGSRTSDGVGGGGGGGAYSRSVINVVPGTTYNFNVGAGSSSSAAGNDSWFGSNTTLMAKGGFSGANNDNGNGKAGGLATDGFGDFKRSGGNGADGNTSGTDYGGGGGSSAGTASTGSNGNNSTGGIAPVGGGDGGAGRYNSQGNGTDGIIPGGGGGGAIRDSGTRNGGSGANGQVIISWTSGTAPTITGTTPNSRCGTGTVVLSATASAGTINWYIAATGGTSIGTGTSFTTPSISTSTTYYVDATNASCTTATRTAVTATINLIPNAPAVGTITQPTCAVGTGSVILNGLPSGSWKLTRSPGSITTSGTGTSTTISNLAPGTYTYTVIDANNGTGLKAEYFSNMTLSGTPALTRTDSTVNFDWGSGNPGAPIGNDNFSVRWSGQLQPLYSENYTFTTRSDDGIRLWVNGIQIINNWTDHGPTDDTGTISLTAGVKYDIVLEFYENGGGAVSQLSWSSASQANQIIPQSQLFPGAVCSSPASLDVVINAQPATPTITPNKVDETCPDSNNGSISPVISGGLSNVRYIKLTQKYTVDAYQQVAEIQAFEIFTGTNVALSTSGAVATASSVWTGSSGPNYIASNVNNGVTSGSTFWHSATSNLNEWVRVDLQSGKNLDNIIIYNRTDCCQQRGQNMLLELFDASNNLVYSRTIDLYQSGANVPVNVNVLDVSWADGATTLNRTGLDSGTYNLNYEDATGCSISSQIDISSITTNNTWTGSVSTDWNTVGNWSCGGVPTLTSDVLIPFPLVSGNFPTISVGDPEGLARDLEIQIGASVTIEGVINILTGTGTGNALNIAGNLTLNGKIDLEGESQLLQDPGSTFDATSTGTIEIDQQGEGNKYRYNYWSMPVYTNTDGIMGKHTTIAAALRNGTNPSSPGPIAFTAGYDGSLTPFTLSTFWMYKFVDSGAGYSAWDHIGSTKKLYTGQGVSMKGPGAPGSPAQNYTFVGKPNNGTIEVTVAANNEYLVGNPYPSAMDAVKFIWDNANSITGAIYYWEHYGGDTHNLAGYQGGYATYSLGGGVQASAFPGLGGGISVKLAPKRNIPVGQAFFVFGDAVDGGQIQFNNGQRIFERESDGNSIFMKNSNSKSNTASADRTDLRPKFRIGFDAPKISHRQLLLTIDERATQAVDWGFDAEIYEVFADDMYWMLNNKKYVIQGTNNVALNSEVPLGIQLSKTGMVTVKIDALENVDDDTAVYLKDKLTGESFNMREKPVQLNLTAGKYADRFVIVFKTQKMMAEDVVAEVLIPATAQPVIEGIHVFMNNAIGELQIKNNSTDEIISVSLTNTAGQRVNFWDTNLNQRTISLRVNTATGVYLVQINTENGATNKKIVVD
jgi:hypothetical protein